MMHTATAKIDLLPPSDAATFRRLTLAVEEDGGLVFHSRELGGAAEAAWGLDDEEITLTIAPDEVARFATSVAAALLTKRGDAMATLQSICDEHGVDFQTACWT